VNDTTVGLAGEVETYEVGGVRMARPFKIRRFGHVGFNLDRLDEGVTFYTDELGFRVTDEVSLFELLDGPALEQARRIVTVPAWSSPAIPPITTHCYWRTRRSAPSPAATPWPPTPP
jgi:hypothetical protein